LPFFCGRHPEPFAGSADKTTSNGAIQPNRANFQEPFVSVVALAEPWQLEMFEPAASTSGAASGPVDRVEFVGERGAFSRLTIWGTLLQALTLGFYRFWLFTDMRRYLWGNTTVDGESLEYTGTAGELLRGYLMALGLLVPIYAVVYFSSFVSPAVNRATVGLGPLFLLILTYCAIYQARRYRLSRTVLRGIRFRQTGSALIYTARELLWLIANICTLGLTHPWALASLERYKMRHTFYGDIGGQFAGRGGRLFRRGILIWLAIVVPIVVGFAAAIAVLDWPGIAAALKLNPPDAIVGALIKTRNFDVGGAFASGGAALSVLLGIILYPAFKAIELRWWLAGLRLGGATANSDLRAGSLYRAYGTYFLGLLALVIVVPVAIGLVTDTATAYAIGTQAARRATADWVSGLASFVIILLAASVLEHILVTFRLWQAAAQSITVGGLSTLENVNAREASCSAFGEGMSDVLFGANVI
jgi:uncharacterized membrane protein YjgN (DUF898 family)